MKLSQGARTADFCTFSGSRTGLRVTRTYSFPAQRAYFTRKLFVRNDSGSPIVLKSVTDCALSFSEPFASVDFHDDNMDQGDPGSEMFTETEKPSLYRTSINVFLRNPRGGLYAGLRYPYFKPDISERGISLSYETNYLLKPGETLELPSTFVGAYRKTGYNLPQRAALGSPHPRHRTGELDLGEVLAMRRSCATTSRRSPAAGRLLHLAQLLVGDA